MENFNTWITSNRKEMEEIRRKYEEDLPASVDVLGGMVASKGFATGPAKIVNGSREVGKVQEGDILVAKFTLPDFVPAMKKAAAIITDIGGVSAHAAIVSRELGKPCVIGLKTATIHFKDGDILEVDAQKGIVRKIKWNST